MTLYAATITTFFFTNNVDHKTLFKEVENADCEPGYIIFAINTTYACGALMFIAVLVYNSATEGLQVRNGGGRASEGGAEPATGLPPL